MFDFSYIICNNINNLQSQDLYFKKCASFPFHAQSVDGQFYNTFTMMYVTYQARIENLFVYPFPNGSKNIAYSSFSILSAILALLNTHALMYIQPPIFM